MTIFSKSRLVGNSSLYTAVLVLVFLFQPFIFKTFYTSVFSLDVMLVHALLEGDLLDLFVDKVLLVSLVTGLVYLIEFILFFFLGYKFCRAFKRIDDQEVLWLRKAYLVLLVVPLLFLLVGLVTSFATLGDLVHEFQAIKGTTLKDILERIGENVKDLPMQSLGDFGNILPAIKKGLIQDSHIWDFFQSFVKQYQLVTGLYQVYQVVYLAVLGVMTYLHFDYWKKLVQVAGFRLEKEQQ